MQPGVGGKRENLVLLELEETRQTEKAPTGPQDEQRHVPRGKSLFFPLCEEMQPPIKSWAHPYHWG